MDQEKDNQISRLEGIIERFGEHLRDSSPKSRFPWEAVTTILAIAVLGISVIQGWALNGKRIDDLEKARVEQQQKLDGVPKIDWTVDGVVKKLGEVDSNVKDLQKQVAEMHDSLMRMGVLKAPQK